MKNKLIGKLLLLIGDLIVLYLCLWLTLIFRYKSLPTYTDWRTDIGPFTGMFVLWIISFFIANLYDNFWGTAAVFITRIVRVLFINLITSIVYFYFLTNWFVLLKPQTILFLYTLLFFPLFLSWRYIYTFVLTSDRFSTNLGIIVTGDQHSLIEDILKGGHSLGYRVVLLLGFSEKDFSPTQNIPKEILFQPDKLPEILNKYKVNSLVTNLNSLRHPDLMKAFMSCLSFKIGFIDFSHFYETHTGKVPLTTIDQIWFLQNFSEDQKKFYEFLKRVVDIVVGYLIGVITSPLMFIIVVVIKLEGKGPALFSQERVGKDGKNYRLFKFRTMKLNAEINGPQWAKERDTRITRFGRILRKVRLDELPQIYNILRGEMSLVGPRPERPEFVEHLQKDIPFYKERLLVKPGLTGWAQINFPYGASKEDTFEKLQYDIYYIKHRSLYLDLSILLKTIRILLGAKGR
jgi:exopolysaccharide biosynthesis polyprenyl glycosylphosphotransferase